MHAIALQYAVYKATSLLYCRLYATYLDDKLYIQLTVVQLAETLPIPEGKIKTTWLLPKDLVKKVKQHALDNDTNSTVVVIKALESFLSNIKEQKSKK
jgi:hypothetical protein